MQSMVQLFLVDTLLGLAIADSSNTLVLNNSSFKVRGNLPIDPWFTDHDYNNPSDLHKPSINASICRSGWQPDQCRQRDTTQLAFLDIEILAKLSGACLYSYGQNMSDGSMFTRHFPNYSCAAIEVKILATFFNVQRGGRALLPLQDPSAPGWNAKMKQIDVPYRPLPQNLATIMFHESMHLKFLQDKTNAPSLGVTGFKDYERKGDPAASGDYPPDGYGSRNAMMLEKASRIDPDPTRWTKPTFNVDSCAMFAMEVWWSQQFGGLVFETLPTMMPPRLAVSNPAQRG